VTGAAGAETLSCWGDNGSGQVAGGVNAPAIQRTPQAVDLGMLHPTVVAAGGAHTCVSAAGAANGTLCFGANGSGQLGARPTPRGSNAPEVPPVAALAGGFAHSCALLSDGGLQCWGGNDRGQLGLGPGAGAVVFTPTFVSGH
jgi:alpha-tubulin suppressor-like RCC1 family protein